MGMHAKSTTPSNGIIIEHPQCTEMHLLGIVPTGKTETVVGIQPPMISVSAVLCAVNNKLGRRCYSRIHGSKMECGAVHRKEAQDETKP